MKKLILCSLFFVAPAFASDMLPAGGYYETSVSDCDAQSMRYALDNATAARRAVITVVKCDRSRGGTNVVRTVKSRPAPIDSYCYDCDDVIERVVDRRYFVEETVEQYRPVVHYEPAGEYVRRRPVCNTCDM